MLDLSFAQVIVEELEKLGANQSFSVTGIPGNPGNPGGPGTPGPGCIETSCDKCLWLLY